ncbi:MAG: orotidine-5'-phosphate decarboxylase [Flavobacteriaceae bacterium TMED42]|nr:MAG: orotidine-5'-phosphate decarboxylase [Flavobacteriaceae bacterium TMED42]|tara:strand:+ start:4729 stop:5556 length:828 start_codon:yes stop_codon:yes gene_type:complete
MTQSALLEQIKAKKSFLCVGLDVDRDRIPESLNNEPDAIFAFCKRIIEATTPYCVAYKPNIAFFEAYGLEGWKSLEKVMDFLNQQYPEVFTIADAKRADIGNTSKRYAKAYFEQFEFDSVTIAPYMGKDSVEPFLEYEGKHAILLALTSNEGASDFQFLNTEGKPLFEQVIEKSRNWQNADQLMYVVGATKAQALQKIRTLIPDSFLLIPGVGAQGGSLEEVAINGLNQQCGLLVNSSRGIIYASSGNDFDQVAGQVARDLQEEMAFHLRQKGII